MDTMDRITFPDADGGFVYFVDFVRGARGVDDTRGAAAVGGWGLAPGIR